MKKYLWFVLGTSLISYQAMALSYSDQVKAVKRLYVQEFDDMDDNKDGFLSKEEFLAHQFEKFKADMLAHVENDGDDVLLEPNPLVETVVQPQVQQEVAPKSISDVSRTLDEMANFKLDDEYELEEKTAEDNDDNILSSKDVMIDKNLLNKLKENSEAAKNVSLDDDNMGVMISMIKGTLPQKIDEITTWTDVKYQDKEIIYVYEADVDTSEFSQEDMMMLEEGIKSDACQKAYTELCAKIKPTIIDKGLKMKIAYEDRNHQSISACEFNDTTCN